MSLKQIDLDEIPQRTKNTIVGAVLTTWLILTIYFQDIVQAVL